MALNGASVRHSAKSFAHLHVADPGALQVLACAAGQRGVDLDADHALREAGEQGGGVAAAGADLEHVVGGLERQVLHQTSLHARRQHAGVTAQRQLQVGEGQGAVRLGHEGLARHARQQVEHAGIEHLPGADLLLDHVEAGLFQAHRGVHLGSPGVFGKTRKF
jgi:hypothetical protein